MEVVKAAGEEVASMLRRAAGHASDMLPQMVLADGPQKGLFCHRLVRTASGDMVQIGDSVVYSAIALIGLAAASDGEALESSLWKPAVGCLSNVIAEGNLTLGQIGLLFWLDRYLDGCWTDRLFRCLEAKWQTGRGFPDTMERSWLLTGLMKNPRTNGTGVIARELVDSLLASFHPETQLFPLDCRSGIWKSHAYRRVLGSFASQVYPLVALSAYTAVHPTDRVAEVIRSSADRMCQLQGPRGEWWWIFDVRSGDVFIDYPVYSVHQNSMGPMALLAAGEALETERYLPAIRRGLEYLFDYREPRTGDGFIDERDGFIWRAVMKDVPGEDPADLPFGLPLEELDWMRTAAMPAWLRRGRRFDSCRFQLLKEARPYCAGWILYAHAQLPVR